MARSQLPYHGNGATTDYIVMGTTSRATCQISRGRIIRKQKQKKRYLFTLSKIQRCSELTDKEGGREIEQQDTKLQNDSVVTRADS